MAKLFGSKTKICVFISGKGSNLNSLIKYFKKKRSQIEINLVVSSNPSAKGIKYALKNNIQHKIFKFINKKNDEKKILKILKKRDIALLCLAGFMKILSKNFIEKFDGKIINIHPSLLPKYKGLNTHQRVIDKGDKYSGCTIHYVNSKLDSGKIIIKKRVKLSSFETAKSLKKKIQKQEHLIYPRIIEKIIRT